MTRIESCQRRRWRGGLSQRNDAQWCDTVTCCVSTVQTKKQRVLCEMMQTMRLCSVPVLTFPNLLEMGFLVTPVNQYAWNSEKHYS